MKILLVSELHFGNISGFLRVLNMLIAYLSESGHQVKVMIPSGGRKEDQPYVDVVEIPSIPLPFYPELRASIPVSAIAKTVVGYKPNIIHLFQPTSLGYYTSIIGRDKNIPMVASFHGNIDLYCSYYHLDWIRDILWQSIRKTHNLADVNLVPSQSAVQRLREKGFENIMLWGRGVNTKIFTPDFRQAGFWRNWGVNIEQPIALYVGRIAKEKNLDIFSEFLNRNSFVQLVFVGDGPYRPRFEKRLKHHNDNVYFTGYLTGEDLSHAYASSDLFLFPSKTETFGQVSLEAMASGLPVVAFQSDGVKDIILHEKTGYLAESDNDWLNYASCLIADKELRERIGKTAVQMASDWTWEKSLAQVMNAYDVALDKHARLINTSNKPQTILE